MSVPVVPDGIDPKVLGKMLSLPHPQMRIVLFYLMTKKDPDFNDAVVMTGEKIAAEIGMNRPLLSRTIPRLVEAGWLREASRHGNVRYYGLGPEAEGPRRSNVVPLRRSA
ncbi:replication initiation protein, RepL2 [Streptomyces sp. NPDC048430]|uniref:replication initiation protein, RepL2 n=1 Tax=Streptomyces sp. NPDC048430 TaxID=3155388 RepID=UPI003416AC2D